VAKSPTERISDLVTDVRVFGVRLDNVRADVEDMAERLAHLERAVQDHRSDAALVRQSIEELKKQKIPVVGSVMEDSFARDRLPAH
jgi:hypothetical protein